MCTEELRREDLENQEAGGHQEAKTVRFAQETPKVEGARKLMRFVTNDARNLEESVGRCQGAVYILLSDVSKNLEPH